MYGKWKAQKDIKGVSAATQLGIKAVLHETQQEVQRAKITGEKKRKEVQTKKTQDLYTNRNRGVSDRAKRDEEALLEDSKEWSTIEAKLRAKSELYDKMVSGGTYNSSDDERGPLVDFEKKSWELDTSPTNSLLSEDMKMEQARRTWEKQADEELEAEDARVDRIRLAKELDKETRKGRKRHLELQANRKQAMAARLKQIKERELKRKGLLNPEAPIEDKKEDKEEDKEEERDEPVEDLIPEQEPVKKPKVEGEIAEGQVDQFLEMMKQGFRTKQQR